MTDPVIRTVLCPWCGLRLDVVFEVAPRTSQPLVWGFTEHACPHAEESSEVAA